MPRKSSRHPEMKALIVCFWGVSVNKDSGLQHHSSNTSCLRRFTGRAVLRAALPAAAAGPALRLPPPTSQPKPIKFQWLLLHAVAVV
jgi:hypothetical protein